MPRSPSATSRLLTRLSAAASVLAVTLLASVDGALSQNTIAVSACRGTPVTLAAPVGFANYAWTPARGIADPNTREIVITATADRRYTVTYELPAGDNLVANPGFESGNTDFTSDYRYVPGGTFDQGSYAILATPQSFNRGFSNCTDPTGARSNMYVADGATVRGSKAWCQRVTVEPGRRYAFSLFVASLVQASPPQLSFSIDGVRLGTANLPRSTCAWRRFFTIWRAPAGAAEVEICIVNDNETPEGNDFALDDISLRPLDGDGPRTLTYDLTVNPPRRASLDTLLCAGERYRANGLDLLAGQSGVARLRTVAGCDSTLTVNTAVSPPIVTAELDTTNCLGTAVAFEDLSLTRDTTIVRRGTSARGCDSTYVFTLRFFARAALRPTVTPPTCSGGADGAVGLSITAGVAPYTYQWSDGSTEAVLTGVAAGTYRVTVRDADGCTASTEVEVRDPPAIDIATVTPVAATCFGEASGSVTYLASGGTGDLVPIALDTAGRRLDPGRLQGGEYVLRVSDAVGCFAERPFRIDSPPAVTLALTGDVSVPLGQLARFVLSVSGEDVITRWNYDLAPLDSLVDGDRLAFRPTRDGRLRVVGTDASGCDTEVSVDVDVRAGRRTYFPTAFTPDGDGVNDAFGPAPSGAIATVVAFEVYDRWGGLVFAVGNCDVRSPECAWEGRFRENGEALGPGVFVYRSELLLIDGTTVTDAGEVTLVR